MQKSAPKRILGIPDEFWIGFVIMCGFFLKLTYNLHIGYRFSTHNLGEWKEFGSEITSGTLGIIRYYYTHHFLPDFDPRELTGYAEPPFYYIFSALLMELFHRLLGWSIGISLRLIQCANVIYITAGSFCGIGIMNKLGVRKRKLVVAILFITFFPPFYNLSALLTPDAMSFMFIMLAMYNTVSWFDSRRENALIRTSVLFGLGMLTAYHNILVLPFIVILMIFAKTDGRRNETSLTRQYRKCGVIAAILTFIWPVYLLIRFHVPLFYIDVQSWTKTLNGVSIWKRISIPGHSQFKDLLFRNFRTSEHNIWAQTFKTAMFDTTALNLSNVVTYFLASLLLYLNILLCLSAHVLSIIVLFTKKISYQFKCSFVITYLIMVISYVVFCLHYPYIEMMNYKMIPASALFPIAGLSLCTYDDLVRSKVLLYVNKANSWIILISSVLSAFLFGFYPYTPT